MTGFFLSPRALEDLFKIYSYIGERSEKSAERISASFYLCFALLANFPGMGRNRPEITKHPVLFYTFDGYHVIYRTIEERVEILTILGSGVDLRSILRDRF